MKEIFLIFKKNNEIIASVKIEPEKIDNIMFNYSSVKEISIIHYVHNDSEKTLEEIYNIIKTIPYYDCTGAFILKDENCFFGYELPIKDVLYRIQGYVHNQTELKTQENLSIRFIEDNIYEIDYNKNIISCSSQCKYFNKNNNNCEKYLQELKNIEDKFLICKPCFLEVDTVCKKNEYDKVYNNMYDMYFN